MRRNVFITTILMVILGTLVAACAGAPTQAGAPGVTQAAATPTPAPTLANLLPPQQVQSLFTNFLASIPADKGYGYISAADLKADLAFTDKPFLLDVRNAPELQQSGYILGAVNISISELLNNLDKLPSQNANIVIYSNSGYRSGMAVASLSLLGYTDVHDLAGGYSSWVHASQYPVVTGIMPAAPHVLTPNPIISDQATYNMMNSFLTSLPSNYYQVDAITLSQELISNNPPTLIDMNTSSDHQQYGYIGGAKFISFSDFFNNMNELPSKDSQIVIYAVGGGHSSILVMGLREMGYTNVYSLQKGILGWKAANLPVQSGGNG